MPERLRTGLQFFILVLSSVGALASPGLSHARYAYPMAMRARARPAGRYGFFSPAGARVPSERGSRRLILLVATMRSWRLPWSESL
jgi:hypothetical protein